MDYTKYDYENLFSNELNNLYCACYDSNLLREFEDISDHLYHSHGLSINHIGNTYIISFPYNPHKHVKEYSFIWDVLYYLHYNECVTFTKTKMNTFGKGTIPIVSCSCHPEYNYMWIRFPVFASHMFHRHKVLISRTTTDPKLYKCA